MTLAEGVINQSYIVQDVELNRLILRRLEALGLIHGTKIQVLNSKPNGAVIFKVRGTRLAIGRKIAEGIKVEAEEWKKS